MRRGVARDGLAHAALGRTLLLLGSPWLHAAGLAFATLYAWRWIGFHDAPITWDPAYFTYMGQAVLRGEWIYQETFFAYPPLGPLASAASMLVGRWADTPTYLAPRYLAVALGALGVVLAYAITRRATGSAWAGLVAGIVLGGFHPLATSSLSTLEPKHLVLFLTLVAAAAAQRGRWLACGCAAALAASSYQPALLLVLCFGVVALWRGPSGWRRRLAAYAAGLGLGLLPALLYLAASDTWSGFWLRNVSLPAAARLPGAGSVPWHWIRVVSVFYRADLPFFVAAGLGWIGFGVACLRRRRGQRLAGWLDPALAGMPLLTGLWLVSVTLEFQGYPDAYPLLPLVAFWTGWLVHRSLERLAALRRAGPSRGLRFALGSAFVLLAIFCALRDIHVRQHLRRFTLQLQIETVRRVAGPADSRVVALSASEFYVLAERRSPLPFLRLHAIYVPFLPAAGLRDCRDVLDRILALRPRAVLIRQLLQRGCEPALAKWLTAHGYRSEQTPIGTVHWPPGAR